jgi:diguanylate cyclase (GGDEF)-like protein
MPELILLDVRMPHKNGFDTCRAVRELPQGRHVPILMLTGLDDVVAVQLAFEAGATDFITKPINWALLAQRLRYALRSREQEARLRESEARLAHAQRLARLGRWRYDVAREEASLSHGMAEYLGFDVSHGTFGPDEVMRRIYHRDRLSVYRLLRRVYEAGEARELEFRLMNPPGGLYTLHLYAERGMDGDAIYLHGTVQDVTARIEAEARISYAAHYDRLTGLPNRVLFWDRLNRSIAESKRSGTPFAVLLVDLDRFSALNATLGHENGDRVLRSLARRLASNVRASDTLSRIAGNEFAVICHEIRKETDLSRALGRIVGCFDEPVRDDGLNVHVSASIGISLYPNDGEDLDDLLMHADVAKSRAKGVPGCSYQFYTAAIGNSAKKRMAMDAALRRSIEENSLVLHYQPLLSLRDSEVWGVEVLLRWHHPEVGLVLPCDFIPILEETALVHKVGEWILRRACEEMKSREFMVSVNLSPMQFAQEDLVSRIRDILEETAFPPERLQLEVTENIFIEDQERAQTILQALRRQGIKVAIDDFGTGFSSLSYLNRYATDFLKIDRSFISELDARSSTMAIVRSTINLGHALGIRIIGEGVERAEVLESLTRMGCDVAQGFLIARPTGLEELKKWLDER